MTEKRDEIGDIIDRAIGSLPEDLRAGAAPNGTRDAAIDAAVKGLSPVIMTDVIPICLSCDKRALIPFLTTSFNLITPNTPFQSATTNGVSPFLETSSTISFTSVGITHP